MEKSLHAICRWTFNPGKGGFVPGNMRPAWSSDKLDVVGIIKIIKEKIAPRLPENVQLGLELHYDTEVNEGTAAAVADALVDAKMYLAMITPGAHSHFGYGGICSLDPKEREAAEALGTKTVDLAYGPLKKAWHPDADKAPSFVLWNGSYGYDMASIAIKAMYQNLKESIAKLCKYEASKGNALYIGIEPKPNEGHPAMLLPTVASALLLFWRLEEEFGVSRQKKGVNKEFGHSEMIGLDHVYDTVEELDNNAMVHMHLNSQGYNDGIILGGPGKYDIDHGTRINGMNIAIAGLIANAGFNRWKGHDMVPRAYDNEAQATDRIVRSILSWEACAQAAQKLNKEKLMDLLIQRETGKAEDLIRDSVGQAFQFFKEMYK
ncbi:MAG: xylose isomerase [Firmicutes bacterium]|nr:xylose isomerase [Bacillota bacterium]